jgi:hypothetical protein
MYQNVPQKTSWYMGIFDAVSCLFIYPLSIALIGYKTGTNMLTCFYIQALAVGKDQ